MKVLIQHLCRCELTRSDVSAKQFLKKFMEDHLVMALVPEDIEGELAPSSMPTLDEARLASRWYEPEVDLGGATARPKAAIALEPR